MLQHTTTIKIASTLKNFVYYLRIVFSLINLHVFDVYLFILELTITHQIYANSSIKRKKLACLLSGLYYFNIPI